MGCNFNVCARLENSTNTYSLTLYNFSQKLQKSDYLWLSLTLKSRPSQDKTFRKLFSTMEYTLSSKLDVFYILPLVVVPIPFTPNVLHSSNLRTLGTNGYHSQKL